VGIQEELALRARALIAAVFSDLTSTLNLPGSQMVRMRYDELRQVNEKKKSVGLNVLGAIIIPFYMLYVFHFLNKDFAAHSDRESLFFGELSSSLKSADPYYARRPEEFVRVNDRSTQLYVILYLFTMSAFGIYWAYTLAYDPNAHFESQAAFKRDAVASFERLLKVPKQRSRVGDPWGSCLWRIFDELWREPCPNPNESGFIFFTRDPVRKGGELNKNGFEYKLRGCSSESRGELAVQRRANADRQPVP